MAVQETDRERGMDCPACSEPVGVATIICQHCGARLARPVPGSGSARRFDRAHWSRLPPAPTPLVASSAVYDFVSAWLIDVLGEGIVALLEVLFELL
jgi:hypothetical protein